MNTFGAFVSFLAVSVRASSGCTSLAFSLPTLTFSPNSSVYMYENSQFWSNTELLSPACVFRPSSAVELAAGIKLMTATEQKFAIRGGGHMGIAGSNSIDDGPLIVLSNLTTLALSPDQETLSLGPGWRWGDVYAYLELYNLTVGGGRLASVGVPGLLLAGGVNFYGNQFGFSADQVIEYEVVTAYGEIVTATVSENADLFWALKGGSSNFGIVTGFKMKTIPSERVWAGIYSVAAEYIPEFFAAIANYSSSITDPLSHIVPAVVPQRIDTSTGPIDTVGAYSVHAFKSVYDFSLETGTAVVPHINDIFVAGTIRASTYDDLLLGVHLVNSTFFDALPALYAAVPPSRISNVELDWQPIGSLWLSASASNGVRGNPLGLEEGDGTYIAWAEVIEWFDNSDDVFVNAWIQNITTAINDAAKAAGLFDPFLYMGDAAGFQDVFAGYGKESLEKLREVSRKWDPERVWQTLLPGGFKLGA